MNEVLCRRKSKIRFLRLAQNFIEMLTYPCIKIRLHGSNQEKLYRYVTKRHPRYWLFQNKKWGAALLRFPEDFGSYYQGTGRNMVRSGCNRALKLGFVARCFDPLEYLDDIFAINQSTISRQNRPMDPSYTTMDKIVKFIKEENRDWFGVFNNRVELRAYLCYEICGEIAFLIRTLGHFNDLEDGIMKLLFTEVIRNLVLEKQSRDLQWFMYGTFPGASEGLRFFKRYLGFKPYNVKWLHTDEN